MQLLNGPVLLAINGFFAITSMLVILGAISMLRVKSRGLAITGSIAAMIHLPFCCCLPGLGFGIWSLVVLSQPEVKDAFS
jgi:hypothetical protein